MNIFSAKALNGLRMLVSPATSDEDMEVDESDSTWLLVNIPALPCFSLAYPSIATELRGACEVESDPAIVSLYIRYPSLSLTHFDSLFISLCTS